MGRSTREIVWDAVMWIGLGALTVGLVGLLTLLPGCGPTKGRYEAIGFARNRLIVLDNATGRAGLVPFMDDPITNDPMERDPKQARKSKQGVTW